MVYFYVWRGLRIDIPNSYSDKSKKKDLIIDICKLKFGIRIVLKDDLSERSMMWSSFFPHQVLFFLSG